MPLPPKGDPQRPLALAIRSTRVLGIVMIIIGLISTLPAMMFASRGSAMILAAIAAAVFLFYLGPGIMYLLCAIYMKQRRKWAIIVAIVMASIHLAFATLMLLAGTISIASRGFDSGDALGFGVAILFTLAFAQLLYHLSQSFGSLRADPGGGVRGFMPITPASQYSYPVLNQPADGEGTDGTSTQR